MKTDDPQLTAFVLGELNAEESRRVQHAIKNDKAIANEVAAIQEMVTLIGAGFDNQDLKLRPEQRGEIFSTGSATTPDNVTSLSSASRKSSIFPWATVGVGIAAAVALIIHFTPQSGSEPKNQGFAAYSLDNLSEGIGLNHSPWSSEKSSSQKDLNLEQTEKESISQALSQSPAKFRSFIKSRANESPTPSSGSFNQSSWVIANTQNNTTLPLTSGNLSWTWIESAIDKKQNVHPSSIRIEEIINTTGFTFTEDFSVNGVTASVDIIASPWNKQSVVAVIQIKNTNGSEVQNVSAGITCGNLVKKFRVLGYRDKSIAELVAPSSYSFEPGYTHTLLCELDFEAAPTSTDSLLTLHLSANQSTQSGNYSFSENSAATATPVANFAVALAYWAQWIGNSSSITADVSEVKSYLENALQRVSDPTAKAMGEKILTSLK